MTPPSRSALLRNARETAIKAFFGGNALVAIIVLGLITLFLCREGFGFFGENLQNLRLYRSAGLEWVDLVRDQAEAQTALSRALGNVRVEAVAALAQQGDSAETIAAKLAAFDQFATDFSDAGTDLNGLVSDLSDQASALKEKVAASHGAADLQPLLGQRPAYEKTTAEMAAKIDRLLQSPPPVPPAAARSWGKFRSAARKYLASLPAQARRVEEWNGQQTVSWTRSITSFLFGRRWVTASFWQDWYGIVPLLVGSVMVSAVALVLAVPLGVASAIYVSEIATRAEKRVIKPYIEFISAIPSVVLGFFGIAVVGQAIRSASESPLLHWVPFFPIAERLNVFTAGSLLALMAVPTIFTLSEDALRNVPRGFKEASYAMGASRLQTVMRVLIPASLSGIISAVLLGLGRVIGETMVVLLCAGNRIAIPDFTAGLGAFFQPVHTMTGIIAQEMGEVVRGSIHYRALFVVGLVLFALALAINYFAQKISHQYRLKLG